MLVLKETSNKTNHTPRPKRPGLFKATYTSEQQPSFTADSLNTYVEASMLITLPSHRLRVQHGIIPPGMKGNHSPSPTLKINRLILNGL